MSTRNLKRRYFLTKTKKPRSRSKMDKEEVATDYKLKQFLADVKRFAEKTKVHEEESTIKQSNPGKFNLLNEKRGLFENGMRSKPSVKRILGLKNKARLVGNLEKLLDDGPKELISPSSSGSPKDLVDSILHSEPLPSTSKDTVPREKPNKLSDWWENYTKTKSEKQKEQKEKLQTHKHKSSANCPPQEIDLIDEAIAYANQKMKGCMEELKTTVNEYHDQNYPHLDHLASLQQRIHDRLEKSFMERIVKNDPSLVKKFKGVLDEFLETKKKEMADKSLQTDISLLDINIENNRRIEFTPDKREVNFVLPIPVTGQPQVKVIRENSLSPENTHFFQTNSENSKEKIEKDIGFFNKDTINDCNFLTPLKRNSPFFSTKITPDMLPPKLHEICWAPSIQNPKKPYFPAFLSPPSPGRNYSEFPTFLQDPLWNRRGKVAQKTFGCTFKEKSNSYNRINADISSINEEPKPGPSCHEHFLFPKRRRVTFSPHRL